MITKMDILEVSAVMNSNRTQVDALLQSFKEQLSDAQCQRLDELLSSLREEVQRAMVAQGRAVTELSGLLSKL